MIDYPFTSTTDNPWDRVVIGSWPLGRVVSLVPQISFNYDIGKSRGRDGATVRYTGKQPRTINLTINISDQEAFTHFTQEVVPALSARMDSSEVAPFTITHPQADLWGIKQVVIQSISPAQPDAASGWIITFQLLEYIPAPKRSKGSGNPKKNQQDRNERGKLNWSINPPEGQLMSTNISLPSEGNYSEFMSSIPEDLISLP